MSRLAFALASCFACLAVAAAFAIDLTTELTDTTSTMDPLSVPTKTTTQESKVDASAQESAAYLNYTMQGQTDKCIQIMLRSDACVREAMFLGVSEDEVRVPQNEAEVDQYCGKLRSTMECLYEYRKCLKLTPKTLYGIMARDARKTMKSICSSPVNKKTALDHLKCFRKEKLTFYYSMLNGYTNVLVHLSDPQIRLDELIGSSCCAFHLLHRESVALINQQCMPDTGLDTGAFVGGLVRSFVASAIDVSCGKHSSVEVCQELQPEQMGNYARWLREGQRKRFSFSPVIPAVKILNILDSNVNL